MKNSNTLKQSDQYVETAKQLLDDLQDSLFTIGMDDTEIPREHVECLAYAISISSTDTRGSTMEVLTIYRKALMEIRDNCLLAEGEEATTILGHLDKATSNTDQSPQEDQ